jgi:hypothetical protein
MTPRKLAKMAVGIAVAGTVLGLIATAVTGSPDEIAPQAGGLVLPLEAEKPQTKTIVQPGRTVVVPGDPQPQQDPQDDPQPEPSDEPAPQETDNDHDGVSNDTDNCPNAANSDQADFDADGKGDECDADDDNDYLSDAAEGGYGTNPYKKDTDGDGWYDGNEVKFGTDPLDPNDEPEFNFPAEEVKP